MVYPTMSPHYLQCFIVTIRLCSYQVAQGFATIHSIFRQLHILSTQDQTARFGVRNGGFKAEKNMTWSLMITMSDDSYGGFHLNMMFHYEPSILGMPHLWNPPYC